jgi:arginase
LIDVPYDCGQFEARMGAGPRYLIDRGLAESLRQAGHAVRQESVRLPPGFHTEWMALALAQKRISALVHQAESTGERAIVLSGNCAPAALGVLGAGNRADIAVLWLDAHADFNTPETSPSGYLDGMALAIAAGHCWRTRAPMFHTQPVSEAHVIQVGVRSVDDEERARVERSGVHRSSTDAESVLPILAELSIVNRAYVHLDLDVIDAAELRANLYAIEGGPSSDQVAALIAAVGARVPINAASITALDPAIDGERAWPVARKLALALAACP